VTRAWVVAAGAVAETTCEEAARAAAAGTPAWIDFDGAAAAAVRTLLEPIGIHPLVLDDMVTDINRPKVDNYGAYLYLVVHSARWDADRPLLREIDVLMGPHLLVTYHDGPTRSIDAAAALLPRRPELLARGPAPLLHHMLDVLVDGYLPIMDRIGEEVDEMQEELFATAGRAMQLRIVNLKRGMSALRRVVGPQRDTVLALTRDEMPAIGSDMRPYFRDVFDRLARVSDLLDSYRDEAGALLDLRQSLVSNRLNDVIKRLTVIATVGLPLTIITSYYGMNFELPEYRLPHAHPYVLGLLAASALVTWLVLRWRRWM
jgi:magnesium transporter